MRINSLLNPVYAQPTVRWCGVGVNARTESLACPPASTQKPAITPKMIVDEAAAAVAALAKTTAKPVAKPAAKPAATTTTTAVASMAPPTAKTTKKTDAELMPPPPPPPQQQQPRQQQRNKKKNMSLRKALMRLTSNPNMVKAALRRQSLESRRSRRARYAHIAPELFRRVFGPPPSCTNSGCQCDSSCACCGHGDGDGDNGLSTLWGALAGKNNKNAAAATTTTATASMATPDMDRAVAQWNRNIQNRKSGGEA